jgi:hypothetical protein
MSSTLLFVLALVVLLVVALGAQLLRTRMSAMGKVLQIFANIRYAEKVCREFSYSQSVKRFHVSGWEKNKDKVRFLPEGLRGEMTKLFGMLSDVNVKIDTAMKFKSDAYLVTIDVKKLEEPLASCREQLKVWVQENLRNPEYQPKRISIFRW